MKSDYNLSLSARIILSAFVAMVPLLSSNQAGAVTPPIEITVLQGKVNIFKISKGKLTLHQAIQSGQKAIFSQKDITLYSFTYEKNSILKINGCPNNTNGISEENKGDKPKSRPTLCPTRNSPGKGDLPFPNPMDQRLDIYVVSPRSSFVQAGTNPTIRWYSKNLLTSPKLIFFKNGKKLIAKFPVDYKVGKALNEDWYRINGSDYVLEEPLDSGFDYKVYIGDEDKVDVNLAPTFRVITAENQKTIEKYISQYKNGEITGLALVKQYTLAGLYSDSIELLESLAKIDTITERDQFNGCLFEYYREIGLDSSADRIKAQINSSKSVCELWW
jgi:hypothetical protein